jgi:hypothetical protein
MPDPRKSAAAGALELPAGRNLDKVVHHALGLPPLCRHTRHAAHPRKCSKCGLNVAHWERTSPPEPYSTDIAAAWLVALWLRERWGQFTLEAGLDWHCGVGVIDPFGSGETAMLAICRAALCEVVQHG